jgi:hypothetical protein
VLDYDLYLAIEPTRPRPAGRRHQFYTVAGAFGLRDVLARSPAAGARFAEVDIAWHPERLVRALDPDRRTAPPSDGDDLPYDLFLGVPLPLRGATLLGGSSVPRSRRYERAGKEPFGSKAWAIRVRVVVATSPYVLRALSVSRATVPPSVRTRGLHVRHGIEEPRPHQRIFPYHTVRIGPA